MSYWSHHPEKLEEITIEHLPPKWKSMVNSEKIELDEVPEKIRFKAMDEGIVEFHSDLIDQAMMIIKGRREDGIDTRKSCSKKM